MDPSALSRERGAGEVAISTGPARPAVRFEHGEVVAADGEPDDRVLVVREGLLAVQIVRPRDGRPVWVELVGPGGTVGESTLVTTSSRRSWSAVALAPSRVLEVRCDELPPSYREELLPLAITALASRVRALEDRAHYLRSAPASQRVAMCLLDLVAALGLRPEGAVIDVERRVMTQQEMALYVGCTRGVVNQSLSRFAARGWIQPTAHHTRLLDLTALNAFSRSTRGEPAEQSPVWWRRPRELSERLLDLSERPGADSSRSARGAA